MCYGPIYLLFPAKAHLRRAIVHHEEALRVCGLCKKLRNIEVLQEILSVAHKRSLLKYSQQEQEDDFSSLLQAPDILRKSFIVWGAPESNPFHILFLFYLKAALNPCQGKRQDLNKHQQHQQAGALALELLAEKGLVQILCRPRTH